MKLEKFIEKLEKGEIKDLKPYIEKEKLDILLKIARRGLEVDYLLKRGEIKVICVLIRYGHASEYYPLWRHHSDKMVRPVKPFFDADSVIRILNRIPQLEKENGPVIVTAILEDSSTINLNSYVKRTI